MECDSVSPGGDTHQHHRPPLHSCCRGLGMARNHLVSFPGGAAGLGTTPENHQPLSSTAKDLGAEQGAPRSVDTAYERD